MKKIILMLIAFMFIGCGNSWEATKKSFKSNFGGYERDVIVYNVQGEVVWSYSGACYIDDTSKNGDVSIIYYENGVSKKADFFGVMLVKVIEK